jgi:hypothetical protein
MLQTITRSQEEILKAVYRYRYMTALDVTYLFYSPASLNHVRELLAYLSGKEDNARNQYLYRFPLPQFSSGPTDKVYTLGTQGRALLMEMGMKIDWYFKPTKVRHLSYGFVIHALTLTRFLVALHYFVKLNPGYQILQEITGYELERKGLKKLKTVIPDAWILLEGKKHKTPILFEIDRGSAHKPQFKAHLKARIDYIESGAYSRDFEIEAVTVGYATTGQFPEYQLSRRKAMCRWTLELLRELEMEEWAGLFRFTNFDYKRIYLTPLFHEPVWFQPDQDKPQTLF